LSTAQSFVEIWVRPYFMDFNYSWVLILDDRDFLLQLPSPDCILSLLTVVVIRVVFYGDLFLAIFVGTLVKLFKGK
jgi:hypothetical protein